MIQNQFKILDLSFYFIFVKWDVVYKKNKKCMQLFVKIINK